MNKYLKVMTFFLIISNSFSNSCYECRDKKTKEIEVCFVQKDLGIGPVTNAIFAGATKRTCGYWADIYEISNIKELEKKLKELKDSCLSIKKLTFFSHGYEGGLSIGLTETNAQLFKGYSCIFQKDSEIELMGCNVGKGCKGKMLLHRIAENVFSSKEGSISAPTFYASSFLPGVIPHFSLDGKTQKIDYDPNKRPSAQWSLSGLGSVLGNNATMAYSCHQDIKDLVNEYRQVKIEMNKKGCDVSRFHIPEIVLSDHEKFAENLSDLVDWDYESVTSRIDILYGYIYFLKRCKPNKSNLKNSSSKSI